MFNLYGKELVHKEMEKESREIERDYHIVDWHGASAGHDDWLTADKTHPSTDGQTHYVATVAKAVLAKAQ